MDVVEGVKAGGECPCCRRKEESEPADVGVLKKQGGGTGEVEGSAGLLACQWTNSQQSSIAAEHQVSVVQVSPLHQEGPLRL